MLRDHIYVILVAFLAALACFTVATLVGVDPTGVSTLRDVVIALGAALATAYRSERPAPPDD